METIFIQVPGELYSSIYERYGEQTTAAITACLSEFLGNEASEPTRIKIEATQYPRPGVGTITGRVWEVADRLQKQSGVTNREAVIKACIQEGININTASTQFSYWRKANP